MEVTCSEDPSQITVLCAGLPELLAGSASTTLLYLTPEYLSSYVRTFADLSYALFIASEGGRPQGAALFCREQRAGKEILRFAGEGLWGYAGIVSTAEHQVEATFEVLRAAIARCRPSEVDVGPLHEAMLSPHLAAIQRLGVPMKVYKYEGGAPFVDTRRDRQAYLATRKKATFSDAQRCEKRLSELGALAVFKLDNPTLDEAAIGRAMTAFLHMYHRQWPENRFRREPRWLDFYRHLALAAARAGTLEFSFLTLDGKPIAAHYGFVHKGRRYYFTPTYDIDYAKYSPGKVLLRMLIDNAYASRLIFDFQNDLEPYKLDWASGIAERFVARLTLA